METFEQKAQDIFSEIIINKGLIYQAGFGNRAIPTYVGEWIIAHYSKDELSLTEESREKIARFIQKYVPQKGKKEAFKNKLYEQEEIQILDNFSVYVNLMKGDRYLNIPFLDETTAFLSPQIIQDNQMLLSSGLWGVGTMFYIPPSDESPRGQIWMKQLKPFQLANVDIEYFCESRKHFSTDEWINLIVSSMGFNYKLYNDEQKIFLISRLIPMVEPRFNLVEPAPKGTGKSFVFDNMSRYVAVRAGSISPAVLFFNDARKTPGLITRYDCVVIDEAQKVKTDSSGELTALLKSYLESGKFGRGTASSVSAESGIVLLANIDINENRKPINEEIGIFRVFPNFLRETAFIDRFSGLLPGWNLPRISKNTPSKNLGFKGDIFGEILHSLRADITFKDYIKTNIELINCDDMRDTKAIEAGASGLLKILFPDKNPKEEEFYKYCVNPAVELRQRIRDELCKLDKEYIPITIKSKYPDKFQNEHKLPVYYEIDDEGRKGAPVNISFSNDEEKDQKQETSNDAITTESVDEIEQVEREKADIIKIIEKGETETVEFKSSLRWDIHNKRANKKLEKQVLKTIVAFLNSNSGKLFIGVHDSGSILGIEDDLKTLKKKNKDGFQNHLVNRISENIGAQFVQFTKIEFYEVNERIICCVNCKKGNQEAFLKMEGKGIFYIRTGNSTREISGKEMLDYMKQRFH